MDTMHNVDAVAAIIDQLIAGTRADQLDQPTPCTEWTVRDLLNHLVGGGYLFATVAAGQPLPDIDPDAAPDLIGTDPAGAWGASCAAVLGAFHADGAFERTWKLPFAEVPGEIGAQIAFADLLVHGWDLATATGQRFAPDPSVLVDADAVLHMIIGTDRDGHTFGPEVEVDAAAPLVDRLVAYTGRRPDWAPALV